MKFDVDGFKNSAIFVVVIGIIAYVLFSSGAINDIKAGNYNKIANDVTNLFIVNAESQGGGSLASLSSKKNGVSYQKQDIPKNIVRATLNDNTLSSIMTSNSKVIFYVFPDNNGDYDAQIRNYITQYCPYSYKIASYSESSFGFIVSDVTYQNELCKSLSDCNKMRERANDHSQLTMFYQRCSKGACIFNAQKGQYIYIRSKDANDIISVLKANMNW